MQLEVRTGDKLGAHAHRVAVAARTDDVDGNLASLPRRQGVEQTRQLSWDARSDQHVVDSRKHRPVSRCWSRHLDLLEIVDAYEAVVALLGQEYLHKIGRDNELDSVLARIQRQARHQAERRPGVEATFDEVAAQDLFGHVRARETHERTADMAAGVSELKAAGQECVQRHA